MAASSSSNSGLWPKIFAGCAGAWLGASLIKFGNPVILDRLVAPPGDFWEVLFDPWPVAWGYWMLGGLVVLGARIARFTTSAPRWLVALPMVWLGWQFLAATQTVDVRLTKTTLMHFAACNACFYLGLFALNQVSQMTWFWVFLLLGFAWALWMGLCQHFGGLESTRQMFYQQPNWQQLPPEYVGRMASNRIFSTFVYPNAFAGAILLFFPPSLIVLLKITGRLANVTRGVVLGSFAYAGLACLYWSGSKSGWLIALGLGLVGLLRLPLMRQVKLGIVGMVLAVGLTGFFVKFSSYFHRGAPSVGARLDYWRAAWDITRRHPFLGTGPGTFSVPYKMIKAPESEMTRLVHNNYLEQASDSGMVGFLSFAAFVFGSLGFLYRKLDGDWVRFSVFLGALGWAIQGFVEFGLYIPALAWPAFFFLGWLLSAVNRIDSQPLKPYRSPRT
jgi:O-antigen ligase